MDLVLIFIAGALLCNCIPHLVAGVQGVPFPTPFATPRGVGASPPVVNAIWGAGNLLLGVVMLSRHPLSVGLDPEFIALVCGFVVAAIGLSLHFGRVRQGTAR